MPWDQTESVRVLSDGSVDSVTFTLEINGDAQVRTRGNCSLRLREAIEAAGAGEYDANEVAAGGSDGFLYMYGPDADALFAVIRPILAGTKVVRNAVATLSYGPPADDVRRCELELQFPGPKPAFRARAFLHISMPQIEYRHNFPLDPTEVARVFDASGIRRPTSDLPRIARMFSAPCLVISAWHGGQLVGLSRSLTDYAYCCYLSDLAVDKAFQRQGVGKELIRRTQAVIGEGVSLILLAAPGAMTYYPNAGFEKAENAFVIRRRR